MNENIPLYQVIKNYLYDLAKEHARDAEFKFPSEHELAIKFRVSRITSKRALSDLAEEGVLVRKKGLRSTINANYFSNGNKAATIPNYPAFMPHAENKFRWVAFIVPGISSFFISNILEGISRHFDPAETVVSVFMTNQDRKKEARAIQMIRSHNADGLLLYPIDDDFHSKEILQLALDDVPVVLIDRKLPGLDFYSVSSDHMRSCMEATHLLIRNGHTAIGMFCDGPETLSSIQERVKGYRTAMGNAGLYAQIRLAYVDPIETPNHIDGIRRFFLQYPDTSAVILPSGLDSRVFMQVLSEQGIPIQNLTIIRYDPFDFYALDPLAGKTLYIEQHPKEIGYRAACVLADLMDGKKPDRKEILIPSDIQEPNAASSPLATPPLNK